ncbi:MAG: amidohydrolase family protein [Actinomycetota bacterium]|nr:amidohydrolase family protein [Actinomycetota bacterium]
MSAPTALLLRAVRIVPVRGPREPGPAATEPVDVLVDGSRVVAVGHDLPAPPGSRALEADGRWLVPGLWDQHVHMTQWGRTSGRLDVSGTSGPGGVLDLVGAHLRSATTGSGSLVGYGYRSGGWSEATSTSALDAVAGDRPVVLVSGDGHNGWLSSAAQRFFGVTHREDAFDEDDWFHLWGRLDDLPGSGDEAARGLRAAVDDAASRGVVGIVDMEWGITTDRWAGRVADGLDCLRVRTSVYREVLDDAFAAGLRTGDVVADTAGLVSMGPLKIISDGSLATRTAHCHQPYPARAGGEPDGGRHPSSPHGKQNVELAELTTLLIAAHRHGLEAAVHTIGDAAADIALDAFAASGAAGSIEHAQLMTRSVVPRMAALHLRASVQPAHLLDDRDLTTAIWPGREDRCFMLRTMLDAGVELALGSDAPVARLDPWLAMAAAVYRSDGEREPWVPAEQISAAEALAASVDGAPTVGAGSLADLAMVDSDPLTGDTAAESATVLRTARVALTVLGGRVTHDDR